MGYAKRRAESGEDVVVIIDSLSRLALGYRDPSRVKRIFGAGRELSDEGAGSLTVIATVLDSACGCVVHSTLRPGQTYTTLELKTVFHKALTAGTPVRAEGRIVQAGRRAAFSEADLRGLDGKLYATATSTCLVMER